MHAFQEQKESSALLSTLRLENFHLATHININILASGSMNSWTTLSPHKKFMIMSLLLNPNLLEDYQ